MTPVAYAEALRKCAALRSPHVRHDALIHLIVSEEGEILGHV
jgi:hypothetical protein